MMELICPKCEKTMAVQKYGEYVGCPHCSNDFFNIDPALVVPRKRDVIFIVRMAAMTVFLLLTAAALTMAICGNAVFYGASAIPLLCALACLRENGFRMLIGIAAGVLAGSGAAFGMGLLIMHKAQDALLLLPMGAVAGLTLGFGLTELLRSSSIFGERCPFCNHRGIRGYGKGITCSHCGHRPYVEPESRALVDALKTRKCVAPRIISWVFAFLGVGCFFLIPFISGVAILFGIMFIIGAASTRRHFKCKRCRTPWALIQLGESEIGRSDAYYKYVKAGQGKVNGYDEGLHAYQNVTIQRHFGCKCCGHLESRRSTSKQRLDK